VLSISPAKLPVAANLGTREVLAAAWPLFQVSLPRCLPLAILGVAASAAPGAEAATTGGPLGFLHSGEWWGLSLASTVLVLTCYAGILRQQLALGRGQPLGIMDSLKDSLREMPYILVVVIVYVLTAVALVPAILFFVALTALLDEKLTPFAALRRSARLLRGRLLAVTGVVGTLILALFVFALLAGILLGTVMNLMGQGVPTGVAGLAVSRWFMAIILSLPVIYAGAVSVSTWRAALRSA
jgi:hypothetical protein